MDKTKTFLLSRTDSIGDMVLTLPMAGFLKKQLPNCKIIVLGKNYTKPVVQCSSYVDVFLDVDDLKKNLLDEQLISLKIDEVIHVFPVQWIAFKLKKFAKVSTGTTNRWYHWLTCNNLLKISRKNSLLHEAQLNLSLLQKSGLKAIPSIKDIAQFYGVVAPALELTHLPIIQQDKVNVILHPKSKGSAKEWGLTNYVNLAKLLSPQQYQVLVCGTAEEGTAIGEVFNNLSHVKNLTGKFSLSQYIALINQTDVLIAASTGPLHIAAALGKTAIGLFSEKRPIHPGRWAPIGDNALVVSDKFCVNCAKGMDCDCITRISPQTVLNLLNERFQG